MMMFDLALQGRGHIRDNIPCQDKTLTLTRNGTHCIALADGAGSAKFSHFGAQIAVQVATETLCEQFMDFYTAASPETAKKALLDAVLTALEKAAMEHECPVRELASTLLFSAVKDGQYITGQLGDGIIAFGRNGKLQPIGVPEKGEFANETCFTTSSMPERHLRLFKGTLSGITSFFLMSDGTAESLYARHTYSLAPIVKHMVNATYCKNTAYLTVEMTNFFEEHILQRTTDDCSIACMAIFSSHRDFFADLKKDELFRIFCKPQYLRNDYIDDYVKILTYAKGTSHIKILSALTQIRPKTIMRRIRKLRTLGFAGIGKHFY